MFDTSTAIHANQNFATEDDGDILFSAPQKRVLPIKFNAKAIDIPLLVDDMVRDLEALRSGKATPFVYLTDEDLAAIEEEHIGWEFSMQAGLP